MGEQSAMTPALAVAPRHTVSLKWLTRPQPQEWSGPGAQPEVQRVKATPCAPAVTPVLPLN